eukprot:1381690-Amphidinium_carterae.1
MSEMLEIDQAKLEQLAWREDTRAKTLWSPEKRFSVSETAWSRTPPAGLLEWITQVDAQDAEGLKAMIASQQQQDLVPTTIAIFSDIVPSSSKTSDSKLFDVTEFFKVGDRSSLPSSPPCRTGSCSVHQNSAMGPYETQTKDLSLLHVAVSHLLDHHLLLHLQDPYLHQRST